MRPATVVIVVCAASAGAHAALVPTHLEHEPRLGIAFVAATALLLAAAVALAYRPDDATVGTATAFLLAALIGAYAVNVTTGLPWLSDGPEPVDLVGLATKSVEGIGLLFSIQLAPITSGFDSLTPTEAQP
jgi:hypothetical protein